MTQLSGIVKTVRVKPDGTNYNVVAGTTTLTSETIDMGQYQGARVIVGFGTITSGSATTLKAQEGAVSTGSDATDLASSKVTVADTDDGKVAIIDIWQPLKRYLTFVTTRATQNAVVDFMLVELYAHRAQPVTQDTTVVGAAANKLVSPAEGTA